MKANTKLLTLNKNQTKKILKKIFSINSIICFFIVYLMLVVILSPAHYITSATNGIMLWANNLLPALFPFFVLTKLLMEMNIFEPATRFLAPLMKKTFNTNSNSSYLFVIAILSGYPVGSKIVADAYNARKIDYTEMHRLIASTSVSGPLFIVGTVGINMLTSSNIGYLMLASHIISAILNGVLYKNYIPHTVYEPQVLKSESKNNNILTSSVKNSIDAILLIGGLICIFYVAMDAISSLIPLPPIIKGLIEITNGCYEISLINISLDLKAIICTGLITFGGLCIHSQAMFFLKECNVTYRFFLTQKLTQTIIAVLICSLLVLIF